MKNRRLARPVVGALLWAGTIISLGAMALTAIPTTDVMAAPETLVTLTNSGASSNVGKQYTLKNYAIYQSYYNAKTGAVNNPSGYPNTNSRCSHPATLPMLPANSQAVAKGIDLGYAPYDGNNLSYRGNCANRYSDAGTNSGPWLPPTYNSWALLGSSAGYSRTVINSSVVAECNSLTGGSAPLIAPIDTDRVDNTDQAYGSSGIFSRIWGASPPSGADKNMRLYGYGSSLIRNQFNISPAEYDQIMSASKVHIYVRGDDWVRLFVNGSLVGTATKSAAPIKSSELKSRLRAGTNIIAMQVIDKAHWRDNGRHSSTTGVCYNLTAHLPAVTNVAARVSLGSGIALAGQEVTATAMIDNQGSTPGNVSWERWLWYSDNPGPRYQSGDDEIQHDAGSGSVPTSDLTLPNWRTDIDASANYICTRLEIASTSSDTKVVQANDYQCRSIGKKPHLQVSGGDLMARRGASSYGIYAPDVGIDGGTYGSWGEYGLFSDGRMVMGSGGSLMATTAPSASDKAALSFANSPAPTGNFGALASIPTVTLPSWPGTVNFSGNNLNLASTTGNRTYRLSQPDVRLTGGTNFSKALVIQSTGTVRLTQNITYRNSSVSRPSQLPQLIILAPRIYIADNVRQIDAWLIASQGISTCGNSLTSSPYFNGLDKSSCNRKLEINGPVQVGRILLRRTAGADGSTTASRRAPAEVFNLRSDAYIWAYGQARSAGGIRTETITELPPRF